MALAATAFENSCLNGGLVAGTNYYISLHTASPGTAGSNEFTGGGYTRQVWTANTPSGGATNNTNSIAIPNAGTTAATHFGLWSAVTAGNYLVGAALASSTTAASITFAANQASITLS